MFAILVALPLEARRMAPYRLHIGDSYPLSAESQLVVTGMGQSALPVVKSIAESGRFTTLISLGTAVGLVPEYRTGMLCIPNEVVSGETIIRCDDQLHHKFIAGLRDNHTIVQQRLAHTTGILTTLEEKTELHLQTKAGVADMESFLIGQAAKRCALNFMAIRVVLDSVDLHLPKSVLNCCVPTLSLPKLVGTILRQPKLVLTLLTFAKHFGQAQQTLKNVAQLEFLSA